MAINTNSETQVRQAVKKLNDIAARPKRTIAVDLDGTLATYDGWKGTEVFGIPIDSIVAELRAEKAKGTRIIIHTTRINPALNKGYTAEDLVGLVKGWLDRYQIPFDEIWSGIGKPIAHEYWDDRAVKKP